MVPSLLWNFPMPMQSYIEIRPKTDSDPRGAVYSTFVQAAKILECSITTIKVNCRKKNGIFFGQNKKTGAKCYFSRSWHKDILKVCPAEEAKPVQDIVLLVHGVTEASKYLNVSHNGLARHFPSPGKWYVRNLKNEIECYVQISKKRKSPRR